MIKNNFDDIYYPQNLEEILYTNVDEKMIDHVRRANASHLGEIAMTYMGEEVTYEVFFKRITEYANALKKYGISKGDCITLAMPNIPETIYYFYACNEIGATPYLIDPRSTLNNMAECIKNSKSKLFICEMTTYFEKVSKNIGSLNVDNIVVVSPVYSFEKDTKINNKALLAKYLFAFKKFMYEVKYPNSLKKIDQDKFLSLGDAYTGNIREEYDPDIPAIIVNTSGTTGGSIKGAMHSNRSYNIYTNQIPLITKHLVRGNTYYGYVPYFSMYGSCVGMHTALSHGIVINNIPKFNGKKSLEEIIKKQSNILIGTPNLIEKLTDMCEARDIDTTFMKQYVIGGDNVAPETLKKENDILLSHGMASKLIFGYGATEAMPIATTSFDERSHVYGSTGFPYPGVSIKIIDPETLEELPYNTEGEIYAHTPNLMTGYLNRKDENAIVLVNLDGETYYKTGDKGYLTEDGILFITGRYKRMMKRPDGHQVSPIPIENAINKNELVEDCAVIGITRVNGKPGVIPTAFVKLKNKADLEENNEIRNAITNIAEDALQNVSGEREAALAYVVVDSIPYTINGKLDFQAFTKLKFDNLQFFAIDDNITKEYFAGMDPQIIKLNKGINRTLKK